MKIRPATPQDYETYCALVSEVDALHTKNAPRYYRPPGSPARPRNYFDSLLQNPDRALWIAEIDGQIMGYVHLEVRKEPDIPILVPMDWVNVSDIVVAKKFQQQGIGHALMEQAKTWAKQRGAKDLRLSAAAFNEEAKDFYRKEGFQTKHEVMALFLD